MMDDELAIRNLVATWMEASQKGDLDTVMSLMTDDVVFTVPGREPFGKDEFANAMREMQGVRIEGVNEIVELEVMGRWAFVRARLKLRATRPNGQATERQGYTVSLFRKDADDVWRLARDANLLGARE